MKDISVIILTYNEEKHIERCINSVKPFAKEIFVVDSFSTDDTKKICKKLKVKFYQNKWINYAKQFNWALDNLPIKTKWTMRMDADEFVTKKLANEICKKINRIPRNINGIYMKRRVYFMSKWIKGVSYYPLLRIWKTGLGKCEERFMDEHIKIKGKTINFKYDLVDYNLNNLTWWINKHNNYATREAIDLLNIKYHFLKNDKLSNKKSQEYKKRKLKENYYSKIPLFIRPFLYFVYRYFFLLGFLDGKEGLVWHYLQGFWYRFLVDAKIYQIYKKTGKNRKKIIYYLNNELNVNLK